MSYVYPVSAEHPLCGTWIAICPDDSCDYPRTQYTISVVDEQFRVTGVDPMDGEEFIIYDVGYDGESIRFVSLMPSTGRTGRNWMRIVDKDKVEYRFTFTERELWVRKPFAPTVLPSGGAEPSAAPSSHSASQLSSSPEVKSPDSLQTPPLGGCGQAKRSP
jgi:hypothetical protein